MSETPRTDNFIIDNDIFCDSKELLLFTNFAARLETELAEAQAELADKDKLIEQMREALELALLYVPDNATDAVRISEAALDAAERGE